MAPSYPTKKESLLVHRFVIRVLICVHHDFLMPFDSAGTLLLPGLLRIFGSNLEQMKSQLTGEWHVFKDDSGRNANSQIHVGSYSKAKSHE